MLVKGATGDKQQPCGSARHNKVVTEMLGFATHNIAELFCFFLDITGILSSSTSWTFNKHNLSLIVTFQNVDSRRTILVLWLKSICKGSLRLISTRWADTLPNDRADPKFNWQSEDRCQWTHSKWISVFDPHLLCIHNHLTHRILPNYQLIVTDPDGNPLWWTQWVLVSCLIGKKPNGAKNHVPLTRSSSQWRAFLKICCQLTSLQVMFLEVIHSYLLRPVL